jgi:polyisoprenoid-binding protein YceI
MAVSTWKIDPSHSAIHFSVRHMVIARARGRFAKFTGELQFDPQSLAAAKVEVSIDTASIDTAEAQRDGHLRSADFFDVEKFPTATFKSSKVQDLGGGKIRVSGDLTIRGVTKPVVLEGTYEGTGKDPWGGERAAFAATTTLERKESLETGGVLVGEKVELTLEVEAVKQAAEKAA